MRHISTAVCSVLFVLATLTLGHAQDATRGPVILTVSGNIANPSRGPADPDYDKFFDYNEVSFDAAARFDYAALATLTQAQVTTDFPQGEGMHVFEGPYLADVLKLAGATGDTIWLSALDGYAMELPLAALLAQDPVLALKRDGEFFGLGDFGPSHLVFARGTNPVVADLDDSTWVWSIYHINVE